MDTAHLETLIVVASGAGIHQMVQLNTQPDSSSVTTHCVKMVTDVHLQEAMLLQHVMLGCDMSW